MVNDHKFNEYVINKAQSCDILSRAEQKEERIRQILDVALDLFVRKGFAATRITHIAIAAKMSKGLMFNYFSSKEELYETLLNIALSESGKLLDYSCDDSLEFFSYAANTVIKRAEQNPFTAKMFVLVADAFRNDYLSDDVRLNMRHQNITKSAEIIDKRKNQEL